MTLDVDSVAVTAGGKTLVKGTDYQLVTTGLSDGCAFEIVISDLKAAAPGAVAGGAVVVSYTSTLNDGAVIGKKGNPNTVKMDFSNNAHGEGTGTTPPDTVIVFTYEFIANKVQPDGKDVDGNETYKPLEGAGFTLYKKGADGEYVQVGEPKMTTVDEEGNYVVDFKGLDDGGYRIVESTVPAGYNKAEDIEFTITAEHEIESADPRLTHFLAKGEGIETVEEKSEAESETLVQGQIKTDVVNREGLELPETGGIGTTIFYVAGAILVAGAVILLVTRKRMSGAEK